MKMANMDAVFDFMFSSPRDEKVSQIHNYSIIESTVLLRNYKATM